jgi:hypothetical protein
MTGNTKPSLPTTETSLRNFAFGVINGILFRTALVLVDPVLVLTLFVNSLSSSNLLAGLVAPLWNACWFLPQMLISVRIQRMERKMPMYAGSAVLRVLCWSLLAAAVWRIEDPALLLGAFFGLRLVSRLAAGLAGLAFFDVLAKTVPARRRGRFFATRWFVGGLLGLGSGWLVKVILGHPGLVFPQGYGLLFSIYLVILPLAFTSFILVREPPGAAVSKTITLQTQLRRAGHVLRKDALFRRYVASRTMMAFANMALPF